MVCAWRRLPWNRCRKAPTSFAPKPCGRSACISPAIRRRRTAAIATWSSRSAAAPAKRFRPWLRLASGSAILAEEVAKGDGVEAAFVNPSALLTQAYRGVGLFHTPLPVRIIASYPSWDRFVFMVHPRTGIRSLADIKAKQYPLRVSVREDPTHSTLGPDRAGLRAARLRAQGHRILGRAPRHSAAGRPTCAAWSRWRAARSTRCSTRASRCGSTRRWPPALCRSSSRRPSSKRWGSWDGGGLRCRKRAFPRLARDIDTFDFSGWPIYASAALPEQTAYDICGALAAREAEIPWEKGTDGYRPADGARDRVNADGRAAPSGRGALASRAQVKD